MVPGAGHSWRPRESHPSDFHRHRSKLMTIFQGPESSTKKIKHENGSERNSGGAALEPRGQGGPPSGDIERDLNDRKEAAVSRGKNKSGRGHRRHSRAGWKLGGSGSSEGASVTAECEWAAAGRGWGGTRLAGVQGLGSDLSYGGTPSAEQRAVSEDWSGSYGADWQEGTVA